MPLTPLPVVALAAALLVTAPAAADRAPGGAGAGVLHIAGAPVSLVPTAPGPTAEPGAVAWRWPLAGQPQVLRRFEPPAQRWAPGHRGVDLAASAGAAVLAPTDGVVVFAGRVVDRPVVSVQAGDGLRTTLEPVVASVPVGTAVRAGQVMGAVAGSPLHCRGGPCLHWGVRAGRDRYLDPLSLLAGARAAPPVLLPLGWTGRAGGVR